MNSSTECEIPSCVRMSTGTYCEKHRLAFEHIEKTFEDWQHAYGENYSRQEYIERLAEDLEIGAGDWVVEVANYLLKSD